ncbi:hypothetical protein HT031_004937 [Scenedesmus sp. PABB004]|nr:hypothetical protein HT031_004937 [Scenedesmus sp. PABB004]
MAPAADALARAINDAAAAFTADTAHNVTLTQKRLLYEFLAYPGPNGLTLSGLAADGAAPPPRAVPDLVYIARRWFGLHIIKHYYVMRQYKDASGVVLAFLKHLRDTGATPALAKELGQAIEIGEAASVQLPGILRVMKQPCARNEAYARVYPLRPFPLCLVPSSAEVKDSSSRHWPADSDQMSHAWLSYASERCRVSMEELDALVAAVPKGLTVLGKSEGRWEVRARARRALPRAARRGARPARGVHAPAHRRALAAARARQVTSVNADHSVTLTPHGGGASHTVPFSAKRAADLLPGQVIIVTLVHLSDGSVFATDWGYVWPTYYAPHMDHSHDFGPQGIVSLVYGAAPAAGDKAAAAAAAPATPELTHPDRRAAAFGAMQQLARQRATGALAAGAGSRAAPRLAPRPVARGGAARARRHAPLVRASEEPGAAATTTTTDAPAAEAPAHAAAPAAAAPAANGAAADKDKDAPAHLGWVPDAGAVPALKFEPLSDVDRGWANLRLAFALPWRRFKRGAALAFKLEGEISDQLQGRFAPGFSMPQIIDALEKAARDPRVAGIAVEIGPLAVRGRAGAAPPAAAAASRRAPRAAAPGGAPTCAPRPAPAPLAPQVGWSKVQELRRYVEQFRASGKFAVAYMKLGGEKEYYLGTAFEELYLAPTGSLRLAGFSTAGTFLRGVLDKVGVEPQVQRIGAYKSAGDQLLRREMSDEQRTQLSELLDDIYAHFLDTVAAARGKTREEVAALLDRGVYDNEVFAQEGWVSGLRYEDEIIDDLKKRTGGKEDEVAKVGLRRYAKVSRGPFKLDGKKRVAVLRAGGAILGKAGGLAGGGGSITPDAIIPRLRALAKDKKLAGVVLRVDSPGGDALASDLMWREIRLLAQKKPVVACMGDVAASGGYYMSMAAQARWCWCCRRAPRGPRAAPAPRRVLAPRAPTPPARAAAAQAIVAQPLTVTGSIGVVTGKFNLAALYERVGYAKTLLSRGKFAEFLAADNRSFTPEEAALFEESAQHAYRSFRDKAAASRGMAVDDMQAVAQGRVWTGTRALGHGLVDALGGLHEAVELVKQAAGIPADERVTVVEVRRRQHDRRPHRARVAGARRGPDAAFAQAVGAAVLQQAAAALLPGGLAPNGLNAGAALALLQQVSLGQPLCLMSEVDAAGLGSSSAALAGAAGGASSELFDEDEGAGPLAGLLAQLDEALDAFA